MDPANNPVNYQPLQYSSGGGAVSRQMWLAMAVLGVVIVILAIVLKSTALFILLALPLAYMNQRIRAYKNQLWKQFAAANNWPVDTAVPSGDELPASIQVGHSPHTSPIIHATVSGTQCDLYTHDVTESAGKTSVTYYFTVAVTRLPKPMPHMILQNKKAAGSLLHNDVDDSETLKLEGNFNDYFTLKIEKGQEVDALAVITPDVMQTLINYEHNENIEFRGDKLYFIDCADARNPAGVKGLIQSVLDLNAQLSENARLSTPTA